MKKIISLAVAASLAMSATIPVLADTFNDVSKSNNYSWAYEYVEDMSQKGLIKGYEDGSFGPGKSVSRMEAFALFGRLMGSNNEINAEFLDAAKEEYKDVLAKYELSYAEGDIAYMMARGVLEEDELDTYFKGDLKSQAMPRSEAAILITKAMLSEKDAKNEVLIDMDYTDVASIPKTARQYVYFVTQKGIMTGMGDGEFSPETAVLRGQIAVMLSKTYDVMDYNFENVSVMSIDSMNENIKIKDEDGNVATIGYTEDARFFRGAELIAPATIKSGSDAVLTYVADGEGVKLAFADVVPSGDVEFDETLKVVYKGYNTQGNTVILSYVNPETDSVDTIICSGNVNVLIDGVKKNINQLNKGDFIEIGVADDEAIQICAMQKNEVFDAVIEQVGTMGNVTVSSDNKDFDGITLSFANGASVIKNGDKTDFSSIGRGDKARLTLEYGLISKAIITSATKTVTGTLVSYTIAAIPTITINRDGTIYSYDLSPETKVQVAGQDAKLNTLAIGANITVTVESDVVKSITTKDATATTDNETISGIITGIYDKNIQIVNSETNTPMNIVCTASTKVVSIPSLSEYDLKKVKQGDSVAAYGAYKNGIFVCTGLTVTPASN